MRLAGWSLLGLCLFPSLLLALERPMDAEYQRFAVSRKLLSIVYFKPGSSELTLTAKNSMQPLLSRMSHLDLNKVAVRIEGFSGQSALTEQGLSLAMDRALAVELFLLDAVGRHDNQPIFLGYGTRDLSDVLEYKRHRVEVVVYDNRWNLLEAPAELLQDR